MFKIYLKGGATLDIVVADEDSKLSTKEFFAKLRSYKKRWYDSKNDVTFEIAEVAAVAKADTEITGTIEDTKKKGK